MADSIKLSDGEFKRIAIQKGYEPVVHGCWIEKPFLMGTSRFCSKCGDNFGMPHGAYRYCPTCGARMDGEEDGNK